MANPITLPAIRPTSIEINMPVPFSKSINVITAYEAPITKTEDTYIPFLKAHKSLLIEASPPVLTKKVPISDEIIPTPAITNGKTSIGASYAALVAAAVPIAIVAIIDDE